ncbi:hypothetical protein JW998_05815 [candidate division KSB1 bacterium]|nr:hypothetical protein [candidate division KSB1 bacterium]
MGQLIVLVSVLIGTCLAPMNGIDPGNRGKYGQDEKACGGEICDENADIVPCSENGKPTRPSPKPPQD